MKIIIFLLPPPLLLLPTHQPSLPSPSPTTFSSTYPSPHLPSHFGHISLYISLPHPFKFRPHIPLHFAPTSLYIHPHFPSNFPTTFSTILLPLTSSTSRHFYVYKMWNWRIKLVQVGDWRLQKRVSLTY